MGQLTKSGAISVTDMADPLPPAIDPNAIATPRPRLRTQIGWAAVGNVGYAAFQWAMLIALTKLVSPEEVGQFGLGLAISVPILMFTNLQLRSIQATRASERFGFSDYLGLRIVTSALALLAIAAVVLVARYRVSTSFVVLAVAFAKSIESLSDTVYGHLQHHERMNRIAISMLLKGFLSLGALAAILWMSRSVLLGVAAMAGAGLLVLLLYDLPNAIWASRGDRVESGERTDGHAPRLQPGTSLAIVRMGLPLGLASLLLALAANVPRYFLERWHGEAALGYFAALAYPTAAFSIVVSAFGQAATPRLAEFSRTNPDAFRRLVSSLCIIPVLVAALAAGVVVLFGDSLLRVLYREEYARYFGAFLLMLASGAAWSLASVLGFAATAARRLTGQAPVSLLVCLATLILSIVLVPSRGVTGAALVSVLSGITSASFYLALLVWRPAPAPAAERVIP